MSYNDRIEKIEDGERVAAEIANRSTFSLEQNVRYLKERLDASNAGSAVFAHEVRITPGTATGAPMYFDTAAAEFRPAISTVSSDPVSGEVRPAESSHVWGLLARKHSDTSGDILLAGFSDLDTDGIILGESGPGLYYLSGAQAGKVTRSRNGAGIPVFRRTGLGGVFVLPHWQDPTLEHQHFRFELRCAPADLTYQTNPLNDPQNIDNPDSAILGWLPADHEVFNSRAPAGAKFGYNRAQDPALDGAWPPVPTTQAYVEWLRGGEATSGFQGLSDNLIRIDRHGIWWMSNEYDDVPWNIHCPFEEDTEWDGTGYRPVPFEMRIWFTKPTYLTDVTSVTSLTSSDSRVEIRCQGTEKSAFTGDLEIGLNLGLSQSDTLVAGSGVIKNYNEETNQFERGSVLEGLRVVGPGLSVTSTEPATLGGVVTHQGIASISLQSNVAVDLGVSRVKLNGVGEESLQDVLYLGFPPNRQSSFRGSVIVPRTITVRNPQVQLRLWVLGRAAGQPPTFGLTYRIIPAAAGFASSLPLQDTVGGLNASPVHAESDQYSLVLSTPVAIAAGDTFLFTVSRGDNDGYPAELGILRQTATIIAGS